MSDVSVVQTLLRQTDAALRRYADPGWRPDRADADRRGLLPAWPNRPRPGSDVQLAYVQAFIGRGPVRSDLALLAGLLDGTVTIEGLTVDTELRWRILHRLVSRGAAGEPRSRPNWAGTPPTRASGTLPPAAPR